ncbi:hypothetical protein ACRW9P_22560 [Vibrio parahaemolyticus]|uniref:hypothetical protein n=1 Tax=Vibrio sp. M260121 TaxID=3020897 RepID=UPI00045391AC|nr:hypothetical protein AJ90_19560 [Vibrio parahaemolyticus M0605]
MSIKQLRAAIAPCCGLGANREEVDAALNNVSAQLSTQEQLLVETLNILEHSLKAIRLDAVTEELLQNHYNAVKAIREHFESAQPNELYSVELIAQVQSLTEAEILRMIKQPGQLQPMPKAASSQIDQVIHELFSSCWVGSLSYGPIKSQRAQLYKNLKNQLDGYWTGHTAYWMLVEGGFIVDGPTGTAKQLTRFGSMFKKEMESINDALQTNSKNLCKSTSSVVVPVEKDEEVKLNEHHLLNIIVDSVTIPWDAAQSIKSIERRVQTAIQQRDFVRAGRLDNVSVAIRNVHNHCQELLNATR